MNQLLEVDPDTISYYLKNIYREQESEEAATTEEISVVQKEGSRAVYRKIRFYNLDTIISVGYRINSVKATKFRIWATAKLKEFITKGFILDTGEQGGILNRLFADYSGERESDERVTRQDFYAKYLDFFCFEVYYTYSSWHG